MLFFSLSRCDLMLSKDPSQKAAFTPGPFSKRTASSLVTLHSLQVNLLPQLTPQPAPYKVQQPTQPNNMSLPMDIRLVSPRSPSFSPTLNSIPEVFEYEQLVATPDVTTFGEIQDVPIYVLLEPATMAVPAISLRPTKKAIIISPRKATATCTSWKVASVLRNVLETDRQRRRRILRIYLKAIVFIKLMLKSHERYGAIMATSGAYLQR